MRLLTLLAVVALLVSPAVLPGQATAGAGDGTYPFPNLETQLDRMSSWERKATRCQAIDVAIRRAVDDAWDRAERPEEEPEMDPWMTPREVGPKQVLSVYGRMRASSDKRTAHRGFQSRAEEALATAKVVACLMYLLGEDRYPGIRSEAARGLGIFGVAEVGERKAAEIAARLVRVVQDDPSPIVRLRAATTLIWLDEGWGTDERIYAPLIRIALDEGSLGWSLKNTAIGRSELERRRLKPEEWLDLAKQDCRARALELLILPIDRLSDPERGNLRRAALALRSSALAAHGRNASMARLVTQRLDRFVAALDRRDREEWYTGAGRARGRRNGVARLDGSVQ
jgi:hypothetical protein